MKLQEMLGRNPTKASMRQLYDELHNAIMYVRLFEILLGMLIWAVISFIILRFLLITDWMWMLPLPVIYSARALYRMARTNPYPIVENTYPSFRERLTTAKDNFYRENQIIDTLEREILKDAHTIETSAFFNPRSFYTKIGTLILTLFIFTATANVTINTFTLPGSPIPLLEEGRIWDSLPWFQRVSVTGRDSAGDTESSNRIFGNEGLYTEGFQETPIELQAVRDALDLSSLRETQTEDFDSYTPDRIRIRGAEYYEETIPLDKYAVVKNYFS